MKKRSQIQIAVDALKKQLQKYRDQHAKAVDAMIEATKSKEFFEAEIKSLEVKIKQLEKPADTEADKVLKALEG